MFRNTFIYLLLCNFICSCITNKDLDIFYSKNNAQIKTIKNITKLSDGDLLYIEIKSLTPTNYDFFNKGRDNSNSKLQNPQIYGYVVNDSGYVILAYFGRNLFRGKSIEETEKIIKNLLKIIFLILM